MSKSSSTEFLFVYGTLINPAVQQDVIGRIILGQGDILESYQRQSIEINETTYPIIVPKTGAQTDGLVLEISSEELILIDSYEGHHYQRIEVELKSGKKAWVYSSIERDG